jgi:uncharacterized protein (TIGR02246 family)
LAAELKRFDAGYIAAFDVGNARALAELFTEDGVVMNSLGTIVSGRSAIVAALESSFAGPCNGATLHITPQQTRRLTDDVAVQHGTTRTTLNTSPPTHRDFKYTKVFVRQGNAWKLTVAHFASIEGPKVKAA